MSMNENILEKIDRLCSFVCNGKTYEYEQKLKKASENELYDAAIIYAWNIFMLFVYEKIYQIREVEKIAGTPYKTDTIFLSLTKNKPNDFFDGNLFTLNKLHEYGQGEDAIIGKLKEVYKGVDQQVFKETQQILQKRNTAAHVNSIDLRESHLDYILQELIKTSEAIQNDHKKIIKNVFQNLEQRDIWHISEQDLTEINTLFASERCDKSKYVYIVKLMSKQEFPTHCIQEIKENAIQYFLNSGSWDSAVANGSDILMPLVKHLDEDDVKTLLVEVFDKRGNTYNQILDAGGMDSVFLKLFDESINTFPKLMDSWLEFIAQLKTQGHDLRFPSLIKGVEEVCSNNV